MKVRLCFLDFVHTSKHFFYLLSFQSLIKYILLTSFLMFLLWIGWWFGLWHHVIWWLIINILEKSATSISLFYPKDGSRSCLWNTGDNPSGYMRSQSRQRQSISSLLWKPQFLYFANMVIAIKFKSILNTMHMLNFMHCQRKYKHSEFDDNIDN